MKKRLFVILNATLLLNMAPLCAAELGASQIEKVVTSSGVLQPKYNACVADIDEDRSVTVKVTRAPSEKEKDCRINSILIAKAIMEQDPSIKVVSVWVHATPEDWWIFQPNQATIAAYGAGRIDEKDLFAMLPMNVHREAQSVETLLSQSVGAGPYKEERLELLNWIKLHSGRVEGSPYPPLPTIDGYLPRFRQIEERARAQQNQPQDPALLTMIVSLKTDLNKAAIAFSTQNSEAERNRQIIAYMQSHKLNLNNWMRKAPARTAAATNTSTGSVSPGTITTSASSFVLSPQQFMLLSRKYPEYTPNSANRLELARRQQAGLRLMQIAESGKARRENSDLFQSMEKAAQSNDPATLQPKLRALEAAIGLPSLPMTGR